MKLRLTLSTLGAIVLSATAAWAQDTRVIVIFHDAPDEDAITSRGGKVEVRSDRSRLLAARLAPNKISDLAGDENVASVSEDCEGRIPGESLGKPPHAGGGGGGPSQPAQVTPWGITRVDAAGAWVTTKGAGIRIAIVDTGILNTHLDFRNAGGTSRVVLGPNFSNPAKSSLDDNGHGTHCAGSAGASDNSIGVVGVAPECTLIAVKVLDKRGSGFASSIIAGIDWAAENADVISMSLGFLSEPAGLHASVDAAAANVPVIVAGGNEGDIGSPTGWPAAYDSVIAVAATDEFDGVPVWSTRRSYIDIAAPGDLVRSTWKDGSYKTISGTSMATPHVAGAAALLIAAGVTDVGAIRTALLGTADDISPAGFDDATGNGLLDVGAAVP